MQAECILSDFFVAQGAIYGGAVADTGLSDFHRMAN
jgi:hypothetical protein